MAKNPETGARIFQINVSYGGVPKLAVRQAEVRRLGVEGDRHHDLLHHGGPERAVCLFSLERILALQAEGHPVFPGALGENVTVSGLSWEQVVPGSRIQLGGNVILEVTSYTSPCSSLVECFTNGDISRHSQDKFPGWSRVYARVVQEGTIRTGDSFLLLPPA